MTLSTPCYKRYGESQLPAVNDTGSCDSPLLPSIFEYKYLCENVAKIEKVSKIVCSPLDDFGVKNNSKTGSLDGPFKQTAPAKRKKGVPPLAMQRGIVTLTET